MATSSTSTATLIQELLKGKYAIYICAVTRNNSYGDMSWNTATGYVSTTAVTVTNGAYELTSQTGIYWLYDVEITSDIGIFEWKGTKNPNRTNISPVMFVMEK